MSGGCTQPIIDFAVSLGDEISAITDIPLNVFEADQLIGLEFRNGGELAQTLEVELGQAEGLTGNGVVIRGEIRISDIELAPGALLGDVSFDQFSLSDLALFDGTGLYPCVRGRICVQTDDNTGSQDAINESCVDFGEEFQCGQSLIFEVSEGGGLSFQVAPLINFPTSNDSNT
jgi:hypothetical protein